jgi:hypothetical protein
MVRGFLIYIHYAIHNRRFRTFLFAINRIGNVRPLFKEAHRKHWVASFGIIWFNRQSN